MRMSSNGEFIHANPATVGVQGQTNVSHGCVNLSMDDARQYYDSILYGDPVEVTGSGVALSAADGTSTTGPSTGHSGPLCPPCTDDQGSECWSRLSASAVRIPFGRWPASGVTVRFATGGDGACAEQLA